MNNENRVKLNLIKLKIKAKSLAAEARIIRKEERKLAGYRRDAIAEHRRVVVRMHARATQLAIACIKKKPYITLERKCNDLYYRDTVITPMVVAMAKKYGYLTKDDVYNWIINDEIN